jgi:endothelin-converting enzyme/putative endopeptidase
METDRDVPTPTAFSTPAARRVARAPGPVPALLLLAACWAGSGQAGDEARPLSSLPYTPGLDITAMDRSVDPCEDFFQYSCGGWIARNPIPADKAAWDVYSRVAQDNLQFLWGILEQAADPGAKRDANQRQIGDYFAACMDTAAIDARGLAPVEPVLREIAALDSDKEVAPLVARLHGGMSNGDLLFGYTALQDFEDSERQIGMFFSGGIGLPERDYYLSDEPRMQEARERYRQHVQRMLELAGDGPEAAGRAAGHVLSIETRLATATLPPVDQQDPVKLNHPTSASALQDDAAGFDWLAYLRLRSPGTLQRINVAEPAFAHEVGRVVADTPLAELKDYLRWSYLRGHGRMLPKPLADESFAFNSTYLYGIREQPPRWRSCVQLVDEDLGEALGREFVARAFSPGTRTAALQMIATVQQVMRQRIAALDWMDEATRKRALEKLDAISNKVGYPDRWRDYSSVKVDRGDFFGNRVRAVAFEEQRLLDRIGRPVDRDEWSMTPQTVNAFYRWSRNDMNFPAGVLQPPLFDPSIDAAPSWGNTGATIGHELVHGFDDSGRHFDARGNLTDWWTAGDAAAFEERAQCLVDQFGTYTVVDDIKLNSRLTLGEDIADLAGTTLAYLGWKLATAGQELAPIEGLTPDQRFFVGNAQWACGHETDERARVLARVDPHSPLRYRVNGVVVNMPEFAAAFQCREGDAMVKKPQDICRIW